MKNILRTFVLSVAAGIGVTMASALVPATGSTAHAACVTGVSPWDVLWMRSGPGTGFRRIGSIPANACGVRVTGPCSGNWCKVRYGTQRGWTYMRYITGFGRPGNGACVTGVPSWDVLWMRSGPGIRFRRVGSIPAYSCRVRVTGPCVGNWCKVRYRGQRGWAHTRYLR